MLKITLNSITDIVRITVYVLYFLTLGKVAVTWSLRSMWQNIFKHWIFVSVKWLSGLNFTAWHLQISWHLVKPLLLWNVIWSCNVLWVRGVKNILMFVWCWRIYCEEGEKTLTEFMKMGFMREIMREMKTWEVMSENEKWFFLTWRAAAQPEGMSGNYCSCWSACCPAALFYQTSVWGEGSSNSTQDMSSALTEEDNAFLDKKRESPQKIRAK